MVLPFGILAIAVFFGLGFYLNTINITWHIVPVLLLYPVWGTIQQFLVIAIVAGNLKELVLIGFVIATPVTWYTMNQWLENFADRIDIGAGVFLLAGLAAILIALATVSLQSIKAAIANPVDCLRNE
jgi:hypothetical protein